MNDQELYEILQSYKAALDALIDQNEKLSAQVAEMKQDYTRRIDDVEKTLFDDILNPAKEALDSASRESRFEEFSSKYGEKINPLIAGAKAIEGEDYDLPREVFNNYDNLKDKPDEAAYVDTVVEAVASQIEAIKDALGADKVEVTSDKDGDVEVKADGEDVTEKAEKILENGEKVPDSSIKDDEVVPDSDVEPSIASPEEIEELEKELSAYKK